MNNNINNNTYTKYTEESKWNAINRLTSSLDRWYGPLLLLSDLVVTTTTNTTDDDTTTTYWKEMKQARLDVDVLRFLGLLLPVSTTTSSNNLIDNNNNNETSYWLSLPGIGIASGWLEQGRKSLIQRIKSTSLKEVKRSVVEMKKQQQQQQQQQHKKISSTSSSLVKKKPYISNFPTAFHVRDLLAMGRIIVKDRPSGQFLRLSSKR